MAKPKKKSQRELYREKAGTVAFAIELPIGLVVQLRAYAKMNNHVLRKEAEYAIRLWLSMEADERQQVREEWTETYSPDAE